MHRLMFYTLRVKCHDGEVRSFERRGYFRDTYVLRTFLDRWHGRPGPAGDEPYEYFETPAQALQNDRSPIVDVPKRGIICHAADHRINYPMREWRSHV